jgi:hypothetical protein
MYEQESMNPAPPPIEQAPAPQAPNQPSLLSQLGGQPAPQPAQQPAQPPQENARPKSIWYSVLEGALHGLAGSGGARSFGAGVAAGAKGVFDHEEQVKFANERAALTASNAARQNFELTRLKQDARIAADDHQMKLVDWYAKTFSYVPQWVSDDDSESAMAGLKQLSRSHEQGVPSLFTLHIGDAGDRGKIVGFTQPPPDKALEFVNYARRAEGVPALNEAQWKSMGADKQEKMVHDSNELWMPSVTEENIPSIIARYRGLKDTLLQRGDTPLEFRTEVAGRFDSAIKMLQAIQSDHVTRKLDYKKRETEITESIKAKHKTADRDDLPPTVLSKVTSLASQFDSNPVVKNFNEQANKADSVKRIVEAGLGGPGDLAIVYETMKALDPSSVVRESEYESASKSGNVFAGSMARFNGYFKFEGGKLPDNVKKAFLGIIDEKMRVSRKQVKAIHDDFGRRIEKITGKPNGKEWLTDYSTLYSNDSQDGMVRIQASDGRFHRIPKDKLAAAQQRDSGLKVVE